MTSHLARENLIPFLILSFLGKNITGSWCGAGGGGGRWQGRLLEPLPPVILLKMLIQNITRKTFLLCFHLIFLQWNDRVCEVFRDEDTSTRPEQATLFYLKNLIRSSRDDLMQPSFDLFHKRAPFLTWSYLMKFNKLTNCEPRYGWRRLQCH